MSHPATDQPPWTPSPQTIARANVTALAEQLGLPDYLALHRWSVAHFEGYWQLVIDRLPVRLRKRHDRICDLTHPTRPRWLVGGRLNIVHPGDYLCWPTSLGWMIGPWLIFAGLMNGAMIALHGQSPGDAGFGRFVRDAGVTMLGLVPSLVRSWRQSGAMDGIDWSCIRCFSSSGECSNPEEGRGRSTRPP